MIINLSDVILVTLSPHNTRTYALMTSNFLGILPYRRGIAFMAQSQNTWSEANILLVITRTDAKLTDELG
jgi:hypothetical protein